MILLVYLVLFGIILRDVDLQDDSKWWCSEFPVYAFDVTKQPKFNVEFMHRIVIQRSIA